MAMRGVETRIQEIRHRIFTEVARMAYHTEWPTDRRIEALPFDIMPGEVGNIRNDIFLERAIVGERLRLAMGLPCRRARAAVRQHRGCHPRGNLLHAAAHQRDQVRVPRLQGERGHGHGRLSGLHGASVR